MADAKAETERSFEEDLARLEGLVEDLEEGDLSLEDSLQRYEGGVVLVRSLQARLEGARLRVRALQPDGSLREMTEGADQGRQEG